MSNQIQIRRGAASLWTSTNTLLAEGEIGYETDTLKAKLGDGSTAWASLDYWIEPVDLTTAFISETSATVSGAITSPAALRARLVVVSSGGTVSVTSITNGAAGKELHILGNHNTDRISMTTLSNLIISGSWVSSIGAMISLQWSPTLSAWVEVCRNEI